MSIRKEMEGVEEEEGDGRGRGGRSWRGYSR